MNYEKNDIPKYLDRKELQPDVVYSITCTLLNELLSRLITAESRLNELEHRMARLPLELEFQRSMDLLRGKKTTFRGKLRSLWDSCWR